MISDLEPLPARTLHVAIDMQRLFAADGPWAVPDLSAILPRVARLAAAHPARTLFARFVPAETPEGAEGRWRRYYARYAETTGERLDPAMLDLVPPLAATARSMFDKRGYSIFGAADFRARLAADRTQALVLTGVETDVCVLASLFDAVDRGLRVVVPVDAVASGSQPAHEAVLGTLLPRLAEQVDLASVDAVLRAWPARRQASSPRKAR